MKRRICFLLLTFSIGFVWAKDLAQEPEVPMFELPPVFVEVEDETKDYIETDLPDLSKIELPKFEIDLPEPENYMLSDNAFAIEISDPEVDESMLGKQQKEYFFDGIAGFGALLNLTGNFKVTKRGKSPNFSLQINHDSYGIYDFKNKVGSGYDRRDTSAEFDFLHKGKNIEEGFSFSYRDRNVGFEEKNSDFTSITDRFFDFNNSFLITKVPNIDFAFLLDFNLLSTNLEGLDSSNFINLHFSPAFNMETEFETSKLNIGLSYNLISDGADANYSYASALLEYDIELPKAVNLGFGLGFNWNDHDVSSIYGVDLLGFSFPFYLKLHGSGASFLKYHIEGGFKNEVQKLSDLKKDEVWVANSDLFAMHGWYCLADFKWSIKRKANILTALEYERSKGIITTDFTALNANGLYAITQDQLDLIYLTLGFDVLPIKELWLGLKWRGNVMPDNTFYILPEHELIAELGFDLEDLGLGGGADLVFQTFGNDDIRIPKIGLDFYYMVTDNIKIKFEAKDLLSPAFADERKSRGIYKNPGLNIKLLLEFSL